MIKLIFEILFCFIFLVIFITFIIGAFNVFFYIDNKEKLDEYYYLRLIKRKQEILKLRETIKDKHLLKILDFVEKEVDKGLNEFDKEKENKK